jgi:predicted Zn-dependent peptidase
MRKVFIFALICLVCISNSFAQTAVSVDRKAIANTTQLSEVQLISEFEINGLKVIVKRRPSAATVAVGLFVKGGVSSLTKQNAGIENLSLSLAIEGGKNFPKEVLRKELSRTGSVLNVEAGEDYSVVSLLSTKKNFDKSWQFFTDVILNPAFNEKDLPIVKEKILTTLKNKNISPDDFLDVLQRQYVFVNHPYSIDPLGTEENLNRFTLDDIKNYYPSILQTSRLLLVIVGNVEVEQIQKKVSDAFSNLPKGDYKKAPLPQLEFKQPKIHISARPLQTNYVRGIFAAPSISDSDYYPMKVAISLLQSRLHQEIRLRRQLSYAPDASMEDNEANTASIYASTVNVEETVKIMLEEIKKMREQLPDEDSFVGLPGFFSTTYYLRLETNAAQVGELARYEIIGGGWRNSLLFLEKINQVKPEDIKRVAQKYMKNISFVLITNNDNIGKKVFLEQ